MSPLCLTLRLLAAGAVALCLLSPLPAHADDDPSGTPDNVHSVSVAAQGNACDGTKHHFGFQNLQYTEAVLLLPHFYAEAGLGANPDFATRYCTLTVAFTPTPGYTYAITDVRLAGTASLAAGATGHRTFSYTMGDDGPTTTVATALLNGPFAGPYSVRHTQPAADVVYAPCAETTEVKFHSAITVTPGSSGYASMMNDDSLGLPTFSSELSLVWKKC